MKVSILLFGAAVLCSSVLRAGTVCVGPDTLELGCIYTNFGAGQSYQVDGSGLTPAPTAVGLSFTPSGSYLLQNIEVAAYRAAEALDTVSFSIYGTTGNFPGSLLETFVLTGLGVFDGQPAPGTISAASVLHPLLEGGMTYWIVMHGVEQSGDVTWNFNSTIQSSIVSLIPAIPNEVPEHWETVPGDYLQGAFALDGSPVPEPSTFALGFALVAAIGLTRRRQR